MVAVERNLFFPNTAQANIHPIEGCGFLPQENEPHLTEPTVVNIMGRSSNRKSWASQELATRYANEGHTVKIINRGKLFRLVGVELDKIYHEEMIEGRYLEIDSKELQDNLTQIIDKVELIPTETPEMRLTIDDKEFEETHENGITASHYAHRDEVQSSIDTWVDNLRKHTNIELFIIEGRKPDPNADVTFILECETDQDRVAIRRLEMPDTAGKSDEQILKDIQEKDERDTWMLERIQLSQRMPSTTELDIKKKTVTICHQCGEIQDQVMITNMLHYVYDIRHAEPHEYWKTQGTEHITTSSVWVSSLAPMLPTA